MKPTNSNIWYVIGLLPLFLLALAQALVLAKTLHPWAFWSLAAGGLAVVFLLVKKMDHLPRPLSEYKELKAVPFTLPIECNAEFFSCKQLSAHSFMVRIVEILSPLLAKNKDPAIIVLNPDFISGKNREFLQVAVCREIERCRTKTQLRVILRLFVPLLLMVNLILAVFSFNSYVPLFQTLWFSFVFPICLSIIFVTHLYFWNNSLSAHEERLDKYLLTLFPFEAIENYINRLEDLQGSTENEKHRNFNRYYAEQRIKKLRG